VHGNTPPSARQLVQAFAVARRLDGRAHGTDVLALPPRGGRRGGVVVAFSIIGIV
jgi:hypothetical protein